LRAFKKGGGCRKGKWAILLPRVRSDVGGGGTKVNLWGGGGLLKEGGGAFIIHQDGGLSWWCIVKKPDRGRGSLEGENALLLREAAKRGRTEKKEGSRNRKRGFRRKRERGCLCLREKKKRSALGADIKTREKIQKQPENGEMISSHTLGKGEQPPRQWGVVVGSLRGFFGGKKTKRR